MLRDEFKPSSNMNLLAFTSFVEESKENELGPYLVSGCALPL